MPVKSPTSEEKYLLITSIHLRGVKRARSVCEVHLLVFNVNCQAYSFVQLLYQDFLFNFTMVI